MNTVTYHNEKKTIPDNIAYLYNEGRYTKFKYKDTVITVIAPYSLERYIEVKKWNRGYIEVMTKYTHDDKTVEEYIDLRDVLEALLMDVDQFLNDIKKVEIKYD